MWATLALQTITSEHKDLQQISIHVPHPLHSVTDPSSTRQIVGEEMYRQWMDLDRILIQFWELRGISPTIMYSAAEIEEKGAMGVLLPEITKRGITELVCVYELHRFTQI